MRSVAARGFVDIRQICIREYNVYGLAPYQPIHLPRLDYEFGR